MVFSPVVTCESRLHNFQPNRLLILQLEGPPRHDRTHLLQVGALELSLYGVWNVAQGKVRGTPYDVSDEVSRNFKTLS